MCNYFPSRDIPTTLVLLVTTEKRGTASRGGAAVARIVPGCDRAFQRYLARPPTRRRWRTAPSNLLSDAPPSDPVGAVQATSPCKTSCHAWRRWLDGSDGGDSETTSEGAVPQRLRVGGRARYRWNARSQPDTIHATPTPCANACPPFLVRPNSSEGSGTALYMRSHTVAHDLASELPRN